MNEEIKTPSIVSIPVLPSLNFGRTSEYFQKLGFSAHFYDDTYLIVKRDGAEIHFWKCNDESIPKSSSCYLRCQDIDSLHTELSALAIKISPLQDQPWGMREFHLIDPCGNLLKFGQIL